jgi:hypothetical protein
MAAEPRLVAILAAVVESRGILHEASGKIGS